MTQQLPNLQQWERGPKIVAIGGGTGLSTMLRGLKKYTRNISAIVTVADDGGGSGVLRRDMGILPPGDVRHCMEALANTEPIMEQLLTYRFTEGALAGQSFGNLFLAALNEVTGSFEKAVQQLSKVLAITGQVIPVTNADVQLEAVFENGSRVTGESKIYAFKKEQGCRIDHVRLIPEKPSPLPDALKAIREADLILLGPGSLYTSIIPNLLVEGLSEALANTEPIMEKLLTYRFTEGALAGQSFGNLFLAGLNEVIGSFEGAVQHLSKVLAITGEVIPVTNADVQLEAVFENGSRVTGESKIYAFKKEQGCRIDHVRLIPEKPSPLPDALKAIREADLILLGPGSLYTSIIPNLLVEGLSEALAQADAPKIYICNIMTQEGETEGCTAADHIEALLDHGTPGMLDLCLANSAPVPTPLVEKYQAESAAPMVVDRERIAALGLQLVERPVADLQGNFARHDPDKLAQAVLEIYRSRVVRIFRGERRYILEE